MANTLHVAISRLAESFATEIVGLYKRYIEDGSFGRAAPSVKRSAKRASSAPVKAKVAKPTAKAKHKRVRTCNEPGCRRAGTGGPRFGWRCDVHRDAWLRARAKAAKDSVKARKAKAPAKAPTVTEPPRNGSAEQASLPPI